MASKMDPLKIPGLFRNPLATPGRVWRRTHTLLRRIVDRLAWPRQQLERGKRFQIKPACDREARPRLIGAQGQFHARPIGSVDLTSIKPAARQRYLCGDYYIPLHIGRGRLVGSASKESSWGSARGDAVRWIKLSILRRVGERPDGRGSHTRCLARRLIA